MEHLLRTYIGFLGQIEHFTGVIRVLGTVRIYIGFLWVCRVMEFGFNVREPEVREPKSLGPTLWDPKFRV